MAFRGLLLPALLLVALSVCAQSGDVHLATAEKPQPADDAVKLHVRPFTASTDVVLVPVTVTDNYGRAVLGLTKDDFRLFEDDAPQEIRHFSSDDAPISIGVLLDLSASMENKINEAREALREFFENANPEDDYFVITFADEPKLLADAGSSVSNIQAKLATVTPAGHTALLDAIYMGLQRVRHSRYQRHVLLIISDGGDNRSRFKTRELKEMVQESDTQIYAIGIYDSFFKTPEEWNGKRLLSDITEATGGHTVTLNNVRELPAIGAALSVEMRNQYVLAYKQPQTRRDGKWRNIKVQLIPTPSVLSPAKQLPAENALAESDAQPAPKKVVLQNQRYFQVHWKRGYLAPQQ